MNFLSVDENKCSHDGICTFECPSGLIFMNKDTRLPEALPVAETACARCGHCVAVCPNGALTVNGLNPEDCQTIDNDLNLTVEQAGQLIKSRRSVRSFLNKPVEKEVLEKLVEIARFAPTGGNSQLVQWLVINSPEKVREVAGAVVDFLREALENGHPMAERYNVKGIIQSWENGNDPVLRGAPALVVAHAPKEYALAAVDGTLALSYLDIAAASFKLGCCWAGFFMIAAAQSPKVAAVLDLPEGNICAGGLMVGYRKFNYVRIPARNEAKIIWRN